MRISAALAPGLPCPLFAASQSVGLVGAGEALSKRSGFAVDRSLREEGFEPLAVAALATLTGLLGGGAGGALPKRTRQRFDLSHVSRNPARFDPVDLATLTHRTLAMLNFDDVRDRLAAHEIVGFKAEPFGSPCVAT